MGAVGPSGVLAAVRILALRLLKEKQGQDDAGQKQGQGHHRPAAESWRVGFQQAAHAVQELTTSGGRHEVEGGLQLQFRQPGQGGGSGAAVPGHAHRRVVAGVFAFQSHAVADPPNGWMEKEEGFHGSLKQAQQKVAPADMGEFVGEDKIQLPRRESGKSGGGKQQHRTQYASHGGRHQAVGDFDQGCLPQSAALGHDGDLLSESF